MQTITTRQANLQSVNLQTTNTKTTMIFRSRSYLGQYSIYLNMWAICGLKIFQDHLRSLKHAENSSFIQVSVLQSIWILVYDPFVATIFLKTTLGLSDTQKTLGVIRVSSVLQSIWIRDPFVSWTFQAIFSIYSDR